MKTIARLSVAAAVAAIVGSNAYALGPSATIAAEVYVGGATAQDPGFLLITRTICQNTEDGADLDETKGLQDLLDAPNSRMDAYLGTDNQVYTCLTNADFETDTGVVEGTAVAIYKTSLGGSGTGVLPISRQTTSYGTINVRFLPVPSALPGACTSGGSFVGEVTVGSKVAANYLTHGSCGTGNRAIVPQVGISDVEPALIDGALQSDADALTTTAVNHGIFGFAVSEPLRNALQAAQDLVPCTVARGDASREATANQPSLTKGQIQAILTGFVYNWNQIKVRPSAIDGYVPGAPVPGVYDYIAAQGTFDPAGLVGNIGCPSPTALGVTALAEGAVEGGARTYWMRRVPSSGTQAITEIWAAKQRCASGVSSVLEDSDSAGEGSTTNPGFNQATYVQAYSSSSGVRHGLDRASGPWSVQSGSQGQYIWAIGNLSCENSWASASGNRAYRFVKIRGAMPGLRDVANNAYDFYAEQVVNKNTDLALPAVASAFHDYLAVNLSNADVLETVNGGFALPGTALEGIGAVAGDWSQVQGQGCLLGVPTNAAPPVGPITAAVITDTPVNTSYKASSGSTNNCQDPMILGVLGGYTPVGGHDQDDAL
jgi:hypothetical protein